MIGTARKIILIFIFSFTAQHTFSQSNEIKIRFIGNCGLHMTDGNANLYLDFPYKSGAYNYMEYDASEIEGIKKRCNFYFYS